MEGDHYIGQLEQANNRELLWQRSQADSMRLVATFSSGVAATVVGVALPVTHGNAAAWWAASLLFASILATICLFALDRMVEPDTDRILADSVHGGWGPVRVSKELRLATLGAVVENRKVLRILRGMLYTQALAAVIAAGIATVAMLGLK